VAWTAPSRASQAALNWQLNKQHQQQMQGIEWNGMVWYGGMAF